MDQAIECSKTIRDFSARCKGPLDVRWVQKIGAKKRKESNGYEYLGWDYISRILNETFEPLGWSISQVQPCVVDDVSEKEVRGSTEYTATASVVMRLSIHPEGREVMFKEDIGSGDKVSKNRGDAIVNAKKAAFSDAIKRCARWVGDKFGLALLLDNTLDAYDLGFKTRGDGSMVDSMRPAEVPKSQEFPWLTPEIVQELKDLSAELRQTGELANFKIHLALKDAITQCTVDYYESVGMEEDRKTLFGFALHDWRQVCPNGPPTLREVRDFLLRVPQRVHRQLLDGDDSESSVEAGPLESPQDGGEEGQDEMAEMVEEIANDHGHGRGSQDSEVLSDEVLDDEVLDDEGQAVPNGSKGLKDIHAQADELEQVHRDWEMRPFSAQNAGYMIVESSWDSDGERAAILLRLAVPTQQTCVETRLFLDDIDIFEHFVNTLSSPDHPLTPPEIEADPECLVRRWGFADFTPESKKKGQAGRTLVRRWLAVGTSSPSR